MKQIKDPQALGIVREIRDQAELIEKTNRETLAKVKAFETEWSEEWEAFIKDKQEELKIRKAEFLESIQAGWTMFTDEQKKALVENFERLRLNLGIGTLAGLGLDYQYIDFGIAFLKPAISTVTDAMEEKLALPPTEIQ